MNPPADPAHHYQVSAPLPSREYDSARYPSTSGRPVTLESTALPSSSNKSKPPKKRVSRACDECRLHKARCDGAKDCETCLRYDRTCTYNLLPIECKGSAARIRILEHRLAKARECIGDLQRHLPDHAAHDLDHALAPQSDPDMAAAATLPSSSFTGPSPKTLSDSSSADTVTTVGIGSSLIESLLQPLSTNQQIRSLINPGIARSILCDTDAAHDTPSNNSPRLPPWDTTIEVIYAAFNNIFALCNIVIEHEFRIVTQRLYDINANSYTVEDAEFLPLFCGVVALGMICSTSLHHKFGYEEALKQSLIYFEMASTSIANDQECASLVKLQTTLCLVLYLQSTSKLDLARPALRIVCASSMVQSLIANVFTQSLSAHSHSDLRTKDLVWTIYYLDMHVAGLLGLSCLLHGPGPELATVHAINTAAHNVAKYKRSDSTFLSSVSIAMAIELMKLIRRISSATVTTDSSHGLPSPPSDPPEWNDLRAEFETWEFMLRSIFAENDVNPTLSLARHQLQCHLYLAQIMLYHGFLRQHSESKPLKSPSDIDDINKGQACVAAATNAIMYISMYLEHTQATTLPFHSAYILFISLLTLIVATSFADSLSKHTIQHSIRVATQALSNANYGSFHAKSSCLEFVQALSNTLGIRLDLETMRRLPISNDGSNLSSADSWPINAHGQNPYSSSSGVLSSESSARPPLTPNLSDEAPDRWDFDPS